MIDIENFTKRFGNLTAVDSVTFHVGLEGQLGVCSKSPRKDKAAIGIRAQIVEVRLSGRQPSPVGPAEEQAESIPSRARIPFLCLRLSCTHERHQTLQR